MARNIPILSPSGRPNAASGALANYVPALPASLREGGTGMEVIGAMFGKLAEEERVASDALSIARGEAQFRTQAALDIEALDPLDNDYYQKVQDTHERNKNAVIGSTQLNSPRSHAALAASLEGYAATGSLAAITARKTALHNDAVRVIGNETNATYDAVRRDPDNYRLHVDSFLSRVAGDPATGQVGLNANVHPVERRKMADAFHDGALRAVIDGYSDAGRFDDARKFLKEQGSNLSPTQVRETQQYVHSRETQAQNDRLLAVRQDISDLEMALYSGSKTASDVDMARRNGLYKDTPGTEIRHRNIAAAVQKEQVKVLRQVQRIGGRLDAGLPLLDQQDADFAWDNRVLGDKTDLGTFVARTGFVPTEALSVIRNGDAVKNPDALAEAALLNDVVRNASSGRIDTNAGPHVELTSTKVRLQGLSYSVAARQVKDGVPNAAAIKERTERFKEVFPSFDARKKASDILGLDRWGPFNLTEGPWLDDAAQDYGQRVLMYFRESGDGAVAEEAAKRDLEKKYGRTEVGRVGDPVVMPYPPERFYPPEVASDLTDSEKSSILTAVIGRVMTDAGIESGAGEGAPFALFPDERTERDVRGGRAPTYQLRRRVTTGIYGSIWNAKAGDYVRIGVPSYDQLKQVPEYQAIAAKRVGSAERERQRRVAEEQLIGAGIGGEATMDDVEGMNRRRRWFPSQMPPDASVGQEMLP